MDLFDEAVQFAVLAHKGQKRKLSGLPAVFHSIETAEIVSELTDKPETRAAAVLHDTVEDAGVTLEQIKEKFGERVAFLVAAETENKRPEMSAEDSWMARKQESINDLSKTDDPEIKAIFLGDKLSNLRSIKQMIDLGENPWEHFHQKDTEKHHWYYRSIANYLTIYENTAAFTEYDELIKKVFNEQ